MFWLVVALAAIAVTIVAVLAMPVQLDVRAELTDRLRGHVQLRCLLGIVNVAVTGRPPVAHKEPATVADAAGKSPKVSRRGSHGRSMLAVMRTRGAPGRAMRLVGDLLAQIHVRQFSIRALYGLGDPADTGQLYGALAPLLVLASARGMDVQVRPDFAATLVEGSCRGTIWVRPLSVVGVIVGFLCSPPVWRAARAWRKAS